MKEWTSDMDLQLDKLQIIFDEFEGEKMQPSEVGERLCEDIRQLYGTWTIPHDSDNEDYMHPILYKMLVQWFEKHENEMNWDEEDVEDFWDAFVDWDNISH
jgi:hypothetical protein